MYEQLRSILQTGEFEDNGSIHLINCRFTQSRADLQILVEAGDNQPASQWTIACEEPRSFRVTTVGHHALELVDDHIVISACSEATAELYFRGPAPSPYEAAGRLLLANRRLVSPWLPDATFLNHQSPLEQVLAGYGGFLGRGPKSVIQSYCAALKEADVDSYVAIEHPPKRWNGSLWVPETSQLKALVFGSTFVVAEAFGFAYDGA